MCFILVIVLLFISLCSSIMTSSKFDSIASIVDYLREPISSSTNQRPPAPSKAKKSKTTKKTIESDSSSSQAEELIQKLPKGRVK